MNAKKLLRREISHSLNTMESIALKKKSDQIVKVLTSSTLWQTTNCFLVFLSLKTEVNTSNIIRMAWKEQKSIFVPRVEGKELKFCAIQSFTDVTHTGSFGIREPGNHTRCWEFLEIFCPAVILVPGLAFDESGGRLGRGGGFYDRFLKHIRSTAQKAGKTPPLCMGIGFDFQIVHAVPREEHDQTVDGLITETDLKYI